MDKRFLIVECPKCSTTQVVDGQFKTRTCATCGRRFEIEGLKVFGKGRDAREARHLVAEVKSRRAAQDQT